jgi:hypothetical protein
MKSPIKYMTGILCFAVVSATLLTQPVVAAGNANADKKPVSNTGKIKDDKNLKTGHYTKPQEQCSAQSQDCDTRTRLGRSRADTESRDHHSEGHD